MEAESTAREHTHHGQRESQQGYHTTTQRRYFPHSQKSEAGPTNRPLKETTLRSTLLPAEDVAAGRDSINELPSSVAVKVQT